MHTDLQGATGTVSGSSQRRILQAPVYSRQPAGRKFSLHWVLSVGADRFFAGCQIWKASEVVKTDRARRERCRTPELASRRYSIGSVHDESGRIHGLSRPLSASSVDLLRAPRSKSIARKSSAIRAPRTVLPCSEAEARQGKDDAVGQLRLLQRCKFGAPCRLAQL